jgi:hypothetical protein
MQMTHLSVPIPGCGALSSPCVSNPTPPLALPRCSVQPSAKREGFATTPEVTWEDVGALGQPRLYVLCPPQWVLTSRKHIFV